MKILVVDDDVVCRDLLSELLRQNCYEVLTATNGREALEILEHHDCRIVISDWVMPEVSGPMLCREIRSRETEQYIFIILLTSREAPEDVLEGLFAGADEFMIKPIYPGEVLARVRTGERILGLEPTDFVSRSADAAEQKARHETGLVSTGGRHRFAYPVKQWAAPCEAHTPPDVNDFIPVECHELDNNSVRFQSAEKYESDEWIVALGRGKRTLFVLSQVDDREMALDSQGCPVQVLDCRFVRRVQVNARRWARALEDRSTAEEFAAPAR